MPLLLLALACTPSPTGREHSADSADSADTELAAPTEALVLSEPILCEAPAAAGWDELGGSMGLSGTQEGSDGAQLDGGGMALDDFDGDGDLDLLLGFAEGSTLLFWRDGDGWIRESLDDLTRVITANMVDLDGDGRRDLLLGREGAPVALAVAGQGYADWSPLPLPDWATQNNVKELIPADIDGDGRMDLYALTRGGGDDLSQKEDVVLWGSEAGFIVDAGAVPEETRFRHGFDAAWFDWDADGDLDLFIANDLGTSYGADVLLENRDGALVDASTDCACGVTHTGMSVAVDDFSGDGRPDLYVTDAYVNLTLQSLDDGTYVDVSRATDSSLASNSVYMSWGAIFTDLDNDGQRDLLAARGDYDREAVDDVSTPAALLRDGGVWRDDGEALGFTGEGIFRSVAALDLNGDGVVDPLFSQARARPLLYLSRGCTAEGWLEVEGPEGARVEVTAGGVTQTTWLTTQSGLGVATPPIAHLGLGDAQTVDLLRVVTLRGEIYSLEEPFEARRRVTVRD